MPSRRSLLHTSALALGSSLLPSPPARAGQFTGRIRKSLKWGMVTEAKKRPLLDCFQKLRECGFEGVEPSLSHVPADREQEWIAASKTTGLVIDGTVGARVDTLEPGLELTRRLGGDSMLVVLNYDLKAPLAAQWRAARERLQAAAPFAEKHGVKILVENVWATFLISAFDMARFIDEVGSPWVQVHLDIGNQMRWGVAEHWVEVVGKRAQKLDVKEYDLAKAMNEGMRKGFDVPLGEGSIQWPAVRAELAKIGFTGWAAAEVRGGDWVYLADVARRMDQVLDL